MRRFRFDTTFMYEAELSEEVLVELGLDPDATADQIREACHTQRGQRVLDRLAAEGTYAGRGSYLFMGVPRAAAHR